MPVCRTLNIKELNELDDWLATKRIRLNNRTRRDLSNVVTIARLFKKLNARLVDIHNYSSHSSLALKLDNWKTFNLKVLRKIGFRLSHEELEQLASGSLSALKPLLYHLMSAERDGLKVHSIPRACFPKSNKSTTLRKAYTKMCRVEKSASQQITKEDYIANPRKQVPYRRYELLKRESRKKDKHISSISHKIQYLESLILVKEERISDLILQLTKLSTRILPIDDDKLIEKDKEAELNTST